MTKDVCTVCEATLAELLGVRIWGSQKIPNLAEYAYTS